MGHKSNKKTKDTSKLSMWLMLLIAFILGIVAFVFAFGHFKSGSEGRDICITIGNVFVVGVVVGFVTNVLQNFEIFKKELRKELYGERFMKLRSDIDTIWENASKAISKENFPEIQEQYLAALRRYLPCDHVAYYDNFESHIDVEWNGYDKRNIKVTDIKLYNLITTSDEIKTHSYKSWSDVDDDKNLTYKLIEFSVNDVARKIVTDEKAWDKNLQILQQSNHENGVTELKTTFCLGGQKNYKLKIVDEKIYPIDNDFIIGFSAKHITNNLRVKICHPADLDIQFAPCGTQHQFEEVKKSETMCEMRYQNVLFPKQGYIFALKPKTEQ